MNLDIELRNGTSLKDWVVKDNLKAFSRIPFINLVKPYGGKIVFSLAG